MRPSSCTSALVVGAMTVGCGPELPPDAGLNNATSTHGHDVSSDDDETTLASPPSTSGPSDATESSTEDSTTTDSVDCDVAIVEATPALEAITFAAVAYFDAEHESPDGPEYPLHHCPHQISGFAVGAATKTPSLSLNCNRGPSGRCIAAESGGAGPGYYDIQLWTQNNVWAGLGFLLPVPHVGHYDFEYANTPRGYGECRFTAEGFADLDDDGVFSTFTRTGLLTERGAELSALSIDMPCE